MTSKGHSVVVGCREGYNLASALIDLAHFEEVKSVLRKTLPVARRVLGDGHRVTLKMKKVYASAGRL